MNLIDIQTKFSRQTVGAKNSSQEALKFTEIF